MRDNRKSLLVIPFMFLLLQSSLGQPVARDIDKSREHGLKMLKTVKDQIKKNYYDPKFHGLDLNARFILAETKIKEAATEAQIIGIIAQAVVDLNDSHTTLIPPLRDTVAVYGWRMQMIGEVCFITNVQPGSDAEIKGLRAGDRVLALDGNAPTRETMWKMKYYYYRLRPKTRVHITVRGIDGHTWDVEVSTKLAKRNLQVAMGGIVDREPISADLGSTPARGPLYREFGQDLIICKFPSFVTPPDAIDEMMKRIAGHKALVLDLRSNPGGRVDAAERLISYFFEHEVKVGSFKFRSNTKEVKVKPLKSKRFKGDLIVLIDSQSSSASEIFARLVQLEKRGTVIGDRSAGMVMQSLRYSLQLDFSGGPFLYGLNITNADIVMTDGKSLEWVGVQPDKMVLPTADDIRTRRDPALAHAAGLAGFTLKPDEAGQIFAERN